MYWNQQVFRITENGRGGYLSHKVSAGHDGTSGSFHGRGKMSFLHLQSDLRVEIVLSRAPSILIAGCGLCILTAEQQRQSACTGNIQSVMGGFDDRA